MTEPTEEILESRGPIQFSGPSFQVDIVVPIGTTHIRVALGDAGLHTFYLHMVKKVLDIK